MGLFVRLVTDVILTLGGIVCFESRASAPLAPAVCVLLGTAAADTDSASLGAPSPRHTAHSCSSKVTDVVVEVVK